MITPEIRAFLKEPTLLIVTKSAVRSRVHRRVYMDYVGLKRFDAAGKLIGEFRIVGLFTSTAYTRSARSIPYLRRKIDAVITRAGLRSRRPLRQGADQRAGDLSARRAVPDRRGDCSTSSRRRSCSSTSGRACGCCRGATASTASCRCSSTCRATATPVTCASGSAIIWRSLSRPRQRLPSVLPGRPDDAGAFHHRPQAGPAADPSAARAGSGGRCHRAHLGRRVRRRACAAYDPARARALFERYRDAFSDGYRENYSPETTVKDIRIIEGLTPARPLGVDFHRRPAATAAPSASRVWSYDRPIPLSDRVPVLENMGFKVVDERTYRDRPRRAGDPHRLVPRHGAGARRAAPRHRCEEAAAVSRPRSW